MNNGESLDGVPDGSRTRVTAVKGQCPRPLDDGDAIFGHFLGGANRDRTDDLLHAMQGSNNKTPALFHLFSKT